MNDEKGIKKIFKRRVSVTESLLVAFFIAGFFIFSTERVFAASEDEFSKHTAADVLPNTKNSTATINSGYYQTGGSGHNAINGIKGDIHSLAFVNSNNSTLGGASTYTGINRKTIVMGENGENGPQMMMRDFDTGELNNENVFFTEGEILRNVTINQNGLKGYDENGVEITSVKGQKYKYFKVKEKKMFNISGNLKDSLLDMNNIDINSWGKLDRLTKNEQYKAKERVNGAVVLGYAAGVQGGAHYSTAIGANSQVTEGSVGSVALGSFSIANSKDDVRYVNDKGEKLEKVDGKFYLSTDIENGSAKNGAQEVAMSDVTENMGVVAIGGKRAISNKDGSVSEIKVARRITGVARGIADTDVATVGQMKEELGKNGGFAYTDENGEKVKKATDGKYYAENQIDDDGKAKAGATEVQKDKIKLSAVDPDGDTKKPIIAGNIADGKIEANSKEAINGGQLHDKLEEISNKGLTFEDSKGGTSKQKLGDTVKVVGENGIETTVTKDTITMKIDAATKSKIDNALSKSEASTTYLSKTDASNTYISKTEAGDFAKKDASNLDETSVGKWKDKLGVANLDLNYKAGDETDNKKVSLSKGLHFQTEGDNLTVKSEANGIVKYGLKSDLKGINSISSDKNGNGTKLSLENDKVSINNKKISGLADGDVGANSTDAVTGKQLHSVEEKITSISSKTEKLVNNKIKLVGDSGKTDEQALNKDGGIEFGIKGTDDYITTKANGSDVQVDLTQGAKDKINNALSKSEASNTYVTKTETGIFAKKDASNLENGDVTKWKEKLGVSNLGTSLELNYKAGNETDSKKVSLSKGLHFKADGENVTVKSEVDGIVKLGVSQTNAIDKNGTGNGKLVTEKAVKDYVKSEVEGVKVTANKPLKFKGEGATEIEKTLGSTLSFESGDLDSTYKGKNLKVDAQNGKLIVGMTEKPEFKEITMKGDNGKDSKIKVDNDGNLTINNGISNGNAGKDSKVLTEDNIEKFGGKAKLKYKANGSQEEEITLNEGLNFTNGTNTTAEVGKNGVVKYNLNSDLKGITSISSGANGDGTKLTLSDDGVTLNNKTIGGLKDGVKNDDAATKGQVDKLISNALNGMDGKTGINGKIGDPGKDGTDGRNGDSGPAGKDGLNGENLNNKVNALRRGEAGPLVYTDENGNRVVKANDGKYYAADKVNKDGSTKAGAQEVKNVRHSLVNSDGSTTTASILGNVADGKVGKDSNEAINGKQLFEVKKDLGLIKDDGSKIDIPKIKDEKGNGIDSNGIKDIVDTLNKGIKYGANQDKTGSENKTQYLGSKLSIMSTQNDIVKMGSTTRYVGKNLLTEYIYDKATGNGTVNIGMSETPEFKEITMKGTDGKDSKLGVDKDGNMTITNGVNGKDGTGGVTSKILTESNVDKLAGNAKLNYKANGKDQNSTTLEKGLDFVNGENTTAKVDKDGKISYDVNKDLKGMNSISGGTDNKTKIGLGDDGLKLSHKDATISIQKDGDKSTGKITGLTDRTIDSNSYGETGRAATEGAVKDLASKLGLIKDSNNPKAPSTGPAGKDGLDGKSIIDQVQTLRDGLAGNTVFTDKDGNRLIKEGDKYYKADDKGNKTNEVVNKKDIVISAVNPDGSTKNPIGMNNVGSGLGLENSEAISEDKAKEAISGADGKSGLLSKKGQDLNKVATTKDLQALAQAGLDFAGNNENDVVHRSSGSKLVIKGEEKAGKTIKSTAAGNILVERKGNSLEAKLADNLTDISSITTKEVDGKQSSINHSGMTIKDSKNNQKVDISADKINFAKDSNGKGKGTISGLKDGVNPDDAVNMKQHKELSNSLEKMKKNTEDAINSNINEIRRNSKEIANVKSEVRGVGALNSAMAALHPLQYDPKKPSQVMAGVGSYKNKQAIAVGVGHYMNENLLVTAGLSLTEENRTNSAVNLGITYKFGKGDSRENVPAEYKQGPISSIYVMQDEMIELIQKNKIQEKQLKEQDKKIENLENLVNELLKKTK